MATGVHVWSTTAATNSTSDSAINWAEGQAPSTVNDSARGLMAKVAEYRNDTAGTLTTAGTSTAYTIASPNATYASLTELNGVKLKIRFNATNGASPTLNVASLGAKAIQTASGTAVATGAILADSVHDVTYDNSIPAFLLSGAFTGAWAYSGNVTVGGTFGVTGAVTLSGTLAVTGNVAVNTDKFTVTAASGNTLVAGTFTSTGATTLSSTLAVTGNVAVNTDKFTVTAASGNTLVAGTLAVTGASTLTGALAANNSAGVTARNTAKAFGKVVNGTLQAGSLNVASITDNGSSHTVTFTAAMANTNYAIMLAPDGDNIPNTAFILRYHTVAEGSFRVEANIPGVSGNQDPDSYSFIVFSNE
jgi:hypothetical protein